MTWRCQASPVTSGAGALASEVGTGCFVTAEDQHPPLTPGQGRAPLQFPCFEPWAVVSLRSLSGVVPRAAAAHRQVKAVDGRAGWQSVLPLKRWQQAVAHGYAGSSVQPTHPVLDAAGAPYGLILLGLRSSSSKVD